MNLCKVSRVKKKKTLFNREALAYPIHLLTSFTLFTQIFCAGGVFMKIFINCECIKHAFFSDKLF